MVRKGNRCISSDRRGTILRKLESSDAPISATAFGDLLGVTRQVIVKDVALLRAEGVPIFSTNRGYLLIRPFQLPRREFKVRHDYGETKTELALIIEHGGRVLDIKIDHPQYGEISADLNVISPKSLKNFLESFERPQRLSRLTDGHHKHTVEADSEETLDTIEKALGEHGFLSEPKQ